MLITTKGVVLCEFLLNNTNSFGNICGKVVVYENIFVTLQH